MNIRITIRWICFGAGLAALLLLALITLLGMPQLPHPNQPGAVFALTGPDVEPMLSRERVVEAAIAITTQLPTPADTAAPAAPPKLADLPPLVPLAELLQTDGPAASAALPAEPYLLADYAAQCQAYMGTVPEFSCTELTPAHNILHAEAVNPNKAQGVCPQLFNDDGNGDTCVITGTVEGRLIAPTNASPTAKVTILFSCRRYDASTPPGRFDDIAVIQHDATTGNTCWFQSPTVLDLDRKGKPYKDQYGNDVYKDWAGDRVPSPMAYGAQNFWLHPYHPDEVIDYTKNSGIDDIRAGKRGIVASMDCQRCHDADPFVWSPYFLNLSQTHLFTSSGTLIDGWNSTGNYVSGSFGLFNADGRERKQAYRFDPEGNPCGTCHDFGVNTMIPKKVDRVVHLLDLLNTATITDHRPWMPPLAVATNYPQLSPATFNLLQGCARSPTETYTNSDGTVTPCNRRLPGPTVQPNIILSTDAEPTILTAGHEVQYTIRLRNQGVYTKADDATELRIVDTLPTGVTPIAVSGCISSTNTPSAIACSIAQLADGDEALITVQAKVATTLLTQTITNTVVVTTPSDSDNIETIQAINVQHVRRHADLGLQSTAFLELIPGVSPPQFKLKYTWRVANAGPAVAANVVITQVLPVGAHYDAGLSSTRCMENPTNAGIVHCKLDELNDGRASMINLVATIPADQGPFFTSRALVVSSAPDVNFVNNAVPTVLFDRAAVAQLYLPVAFTARQRGPDLVVKEIRLTPETAEVVIQNIGDTPLSATDRFWVDLYINPNPPPTGVNQTVQERQSDGLVWGVISPTLQLAPGESYTLRVGDHYYDREQSSRPAVIKAGSVIYVQVDSSNLESDNGGLVEGHELDGSAYNNISSSNVAETVLTAKWEANPATSALVRLWNTGRSHNLPFRP